jgi:hypothetical protein
VRAQLLQEFEEKRQKRSALNSEPVAQITTGLGRTIGARIQARLVDWDATLRGHPRVADLACVGKLPLLSEPSSRR